MQQAPGRLVLALEMGRAIRDPIRGVASVEVGGSGVEYVVGYFDQPDGVSAGPLPPASSMPTPTRTNGAGAIRRWWRQVPVRDVIQALADLTGHEATLYRLLRLRPGGQPGRARIGVDRSPAADPPGPSEVYERYAGSTYKAHTAAAIPLAAGARPWVITLASPAQLRAWSSDAVLLR